MRIFFTLLLCYLTSTLLLATHNRAGEITYEQIDALTIKATITTYAKTTSIQADRDSLRICWGDGTCEMLLRANGEGDPQENDYKINTYIGTHVYEAMGTYPISMTDPNRNGAVLNVNAPNSDQVQFHLQSSVTLMEMTAGQSNQSPTLLVPPIDVGFVRQRFMHTPSAVDLDGDSIAYELVTPLMENDRPVPNYVQVDEIGAGADNSYAFDEQTGLFVWNSPQIVGQYNIAIKVKAYRNGELVDMLIRDMQILIQGAYNTPPALEIQNFMPPTIKITPGKVVDFNFFGIDMEDQLSDLNPDLSVASEVLELGGSVVYTNNQGTRVGNFTWTPTMDDIRSLPYQVTLRAVDSEGAASFKIVNIQVSEFSTTISDNFNQEGYELFPNPTTGMAYLKVPSKILNQITTLFIFDHLGKMVQRQQFDISSDLISLPTTDLPKGNYIIQLMSEQANVSTSLIVH